MNCRGCTRTEILEKMAKTTSGSFSKMLDALVASDFVESYFPFGGNKREVVYRLVDPFCLFHQKFIAGSKTLDAEFWKNNVTSQQLNSWRGFAFEEICFRHVAQIKQALGITGVASTQSAWALKGDGDNQGAQIDMLLDRKDDIVDMCEMKFYSEEFTVSKDYHSILVYREKLLAGQMPKKKVVHSVLITTYGLKYNEYTGDFQNVVTLEDLFR